MHVDKSSLSTEVQHEEVAQTANTSINNKDTKKDETVATNDNPDKSSSPIALVTQEPLQTTSLARDNNDNTPTPELEAKSNEPAKVSTTPSPNAQVDPSPDSVTTRASPSTKNNSSTLDAKTTTTLETSTTQIPNSDSNKQSTANDNMNALPTADHLTSTDPTSNQDSNSTNQTDPPKANSVTKQTENQSTHNDQQPNNESSTSRIPDSDATKQANTVATSDSSKNSTTMVPNSNQDANIVDQNNPPTTDDDTKQATNQSNNTANTDPQTSKDEHGDPLPTVEPSSSRIPDSDANKQANTNTTDNLPQSSTTMVPNSNQDANIVDQNNPPTTDSNTKQATNQSIKTDSPDPQTDKKGPLSDTTPKLERQHLENLIKQELKIVENNCPKLSEHREKIMMEAKKITNQFAKLQNETCDLKDLKKLKRTATKLKLQIPPRYMTYDESEKQKNQQSRVDSSDNISVKLQNKMPRLHDKLFHESPICKSIHLRFNTLKPHVLKLCLLCFTVFPENAIISRRSMIYWWIGEGLIPGEDDTAEDRANDNFKILMDKDFIEPASKSYGALKSDDPRYVATCKMNPMVRAALVMIADKLKFFDFDKFGNPKDFGKFDEIESPEDMPDVYPLGEPTEFFEFYDINNNKISGPIHLVDSDMNPCQFAARRTDGQEPVKRNGEKIDKSKEHYLYQKKELTTKSYKVCLMGSGLSKGIPWENLHMLINVQDVILDFKPEWFLRMKNINVLFLGKWESKVAHHIEVDDFDFEKSLDNLNHVRFFSLQGVSRITKLPDSISKLKRLLILDLRACHNLEVIPESIGLLKCLTHLDMSECYLLRKIPKEISSLVSLQVLKGFVVVENPTREVCTLQDLKKLVNLTKLSMYTHMKNFPQGPHLDALQKLETLRKLTILWGGHESMPKTNQPKQDDKNNEKPNLVSKVKKLIPKKNWVQGSMRRMNAFNNSTLGSRLEKLDLKCYPHLETPPWITAGNLQGLKKLYIRGGFFSDLGQYKDMLKLDDSPIPPKETWNVETLRLKYLDELDMEWRELQNLFPKLRSLEKVKCPRLALFPCNEKGVWKIGSTTT